MVSALSSEDSNVDMGLGFLGQYITAAELVGKSPTLTVEKITLEKVESMKPTDDEGGGKMRDRIVVYFKEARGGRGWLLNRTNAECIKELWGRETDGWLGKRITLHTMNVRVGPKMEPGIRVKGSPDLTEPRTFDLRLPRKKPIKTTLVPTGKAAPPRPAQKTLQQYREDIDNATSAETASLVLDEARDVLTPAEVEELGKAYAMAWTQ